MKLVVFGCLLLAVTVQASANGGYYTCDQTFPNEVCVFDAVASADGGIWNTVYKHADTPITGGSTIAVVDPANTMYRLRDEESNVNTGATLTVSPKPWANGVTLTDATSAEMQEGTDWNFVLAFEMVQPLRDMFMFTPELAVNPNAAGYDADIYDAYTKVFADCSIKDEEVMHDGKLIYSTTTLIDQMYPIDSTVVGPSRHNYVLQYLEEGAIDLVCLMTDLVMDDRCPEVRAKNGIKDGEYSNCWEPAYEEFYSANPTSTTTNRASRWVEPLQELASIDGPGLTIAVDSDGSLSCVALAEGSDAPTATQIEAGTDSVGAAADGTLLGAVTGYNSFSFNFDGLIDSHSYDAYCAFDGARTHTANFVYMSGTPGDSGDSGDSGDVCASDMCDMNDIWARAEAAGIDTSQFPHNL